MVENQAHYRGGRLAATTVNRLTFKMQIEQPRQCTYSVTLRRFRATIVAVENNE